MYSGTFLTHTVRIHVCLYLPAKAAQNILNIGKQKERH